MSILLNPLIFAAVDRFDERSETLPDATPRKDDSAASAPAAKRSRPSLSPTSLSKHALLVGYGRVGSIIGETLQATNTPFIVIEASDLIVASLHKEGIEAISGNAVRPEVLQAANLAGATTVFVTIPEAFEAGQVVEQASAANPAICIIARAHSGAEAEI